MLGTFQKAFFQALTSQICNYLSRSLPQRSAPIAAWGTSEGLIQHLRSCRMGNFPWENTYNTFWDMGAFLFETS